jgi:ACS family tartrate transporter-like MFS transporter
VLELGAECQSVFPNAALFALQWLFLIEGVPSVLLGVAIAVWLPSSPLTAAILSREEGQLLHERVSQQQQQQQQQH